MIIPGNGYIIFEVLTAPCPLLPTCPLYSNITWLPLITGTVWVP